MDTLLDAYGPPLASERRAFTALTKEPVTEAKDLGAGVKGVVVCDHPAFRNAEVDLQTWIAQGEEPYRCRFTIAGRDAP